MQTTKHNTNNATLYKQQKTQYNTNNKTQYEHQNIIQATKQITNNKTTKQTWKNGTN